MACKHSETQRAIMVGLLKRKGLQSDQQAGSHPTTQPTNQNNQRPMCNPSTQQTPTNKRALPTKPNKPSCWLVQVVGLLMLQPMPNTKRTTLHNPNPTYIDKLSSRTRSTIQKANLPITALPVQQSNYNKQIAEQAKQARQPNRKHIMEPSDNKPNPQQAQKLNRKTPNTLAKPTDPAASKAHQHKSKTQQTLLLCLCCIDDTTNTDHVNSLLQLRLRLNSQINACRLQCCTVVLC